jgi:hypothetical protein
MGECGCANGFGDLKLAGPRGQLYTLRLACACDYCETPLAFLVDWHSSAGKKASAEDLEDIPEFKVAPMEYSKDFGGSALPVVEPLELAKALLSRGLLAGAVDAEAEPDAWLDDVRDALNEAAFATWGKWLADRANEDETDA